LSPVFQTAISKLNFYAAEVPGSCKNYLTQKGQKEKGWVADVIETDFKILVKQEEN